MMNACLKHEMHAGHEGLDAMEAAITVLSSDQDGNSPPIVARMLTCLPHVFVSAQP